MNPTPSRMFLRQQRLHAASRQTEAELQPEELRRLQQLGRKGYLVGRLASTQHLLSTCFSPFPVSTCLYLSSGRVGRTFLSNIRRKPEEIEFDPDSLSFGQDEETLRTGNPSVYTG